MATTIIKNTALTVKSWGGITINASSSYTMQEADRSRLLGDSTFLTDLGSAVAVVNNGTSDLAAAVGLDYLYGAAIDYYFDNATNGFLAKDVQTAIEEASIIPSVIEYYGDGSDGVVALSSGTTTLNRTMFYSSLTLSGTAVINTNGFAIHVKTTCSISGTAVIQNNGGNGTAAVTNTSPGTGGTAAPGLDHGTGQSGATGGIAASGIGGSVSAWSGYGGAGGVGGAGGTRSSVASGTAGTVGAYTYYPERIIRRDHLMNFSYKNVGQAGSAGGAGKDNSGGDGGGSGAGGGAVLIFAKTFINTSSLGVSAKGGNGGAGGNAAASNNSGGGGGGGGGGGFIYIVGYDVTLGTVSVAGGTGGAGGAFSGTAVTNGSAGSSGSSGHYSVYAARTNTWTVL